VYQFPIALIGAIVLKEISFIYAEGYTVSEMKHDSIALIDDNMPEYIHFHLVLVDK